MQDRNMRKKRREEDYIASGMIRFNSYRKGHDIAFTLMFILFAFLCLLPLIFVFIISLSSDASIRAVGYSFFPVEWTGTAYQYLWRLRQTVGRAVFNSLFVTIVGTVLSVFLISTMGYVLSRKHFVLRRFYTVLIFIPMLFSGGLLSTYVVNTQMLGLKNTYLALILPLACSSFYIIVMRSFFDVMVPQEVIESGQIDGASHIRIFFSLALPLSKPALATIGLFQSFAYWNDWYQARLYLDSGAKSLFPLQYILMNIENNIKLLATNDSFASAFSGISIPGESIRMAIVVITVLPIMLAYPFFQRYFTSGLIVGAIKG